jgi:hypothetical protein
MKITWTSELENFLKELFNQKENREITCQGLAELFSQKIQIQISYTTLLKKFKGNILKHNQCICLYKIKYKFLQFKLRIKSDHF